MLTSPKSDISQINNLKDFNDLQDEFNKLIVQKGQELIDSLVIPFLANNPEIKAVAWQQYTPYFNDGDPCVFGVGDIEYVVEKDSPHFNSIWDEGDVYLPGVELEPGLGFSGSFKLNHIKDANNKMVKETIPGTDISIWKVETELPNTKTLYYNCCIFSNAFNKAEKILEQVFGDSVSIYCDGTGYQTYEFDHD